MYLLSCKKYDGAYEMNKTKITRITCDIDTKNINDILKCLKTFKKYHFDKELQIKQSPSNKGFHVISWSEKGVTLKKLLKIRKKAGDDRIRCMLDSKTHRMINVLFTSKRKQKSNLKIDDRIMDIEVLGSEENIKISIGET